MAEDLNTYPPEEHRPVEGADTLGGVLTAARMEHGLTVEQMAAELRVEARLLEALEEDRFDLLPAPVFVKGYLRHLASRFDLKYDDLLHRYAVQTDAKDAPVTYSEPISEENRLVVPLIVGALVLVLGIPAFWFTWVSRDTLSEIVSPAEEAPESPPEQVESVPDVAAPFPEPGDAIEPAALFSEPGVATEPGVPPSAVGLDTLAPPSTETASGVEAPTDDALVTGSDPAAAPTAGDEPVDAPAAVDAAAPAAVDAAAPAAVDAAAPAAVDGPAGAPAAVDGPGVETSAVNPTLPGGQQPVGAAPAVELQPPEPATAEPAAVDPDATEPGAAEPGAAEPGAAEPGAAIVTETLATGQATGPLVQIALSYAEDSWTEVSDGNGNSLYYDLGRAGTTATVEGVLPLSFVLGNFTVVQLAINDQPWPIPEPPGGGTTVRFVVDEAP